MHPNCKLKINYILPDFDERAHSGGLYVIFEHCNRLAGRGHTVRAFNNTGIKSKYLNLNCPIEIHNKNARVIEDGSPDIIVSTHWRTYFFLERLEEAFRNNTKLCMLVQSDDRFIVSDEEVPYVKRALTSRYRDLADIHKIAVSAYIRDMLKEDFGQDSAYIRNGICVDEVKPLLPPSDKIRIAARYDPSAYRGWRMVDSVLGRIARERPDVEIHLYEMKDKRPTPYRSRFHKSLTGERLASLFKSCDIYLSGSEYEGFGYPILEAMSQGSAVCATDAGGNREFCLDGKTALISPKGDSEALYKNAIKLIDDAELRKRLSENGRRKALEFGWEGPIEKLEEFFLGLAAVPYDERTVAIGMTGRSILRKRALVVHDEDPFVNYSDWLKIEEDVRRLEAADIAADVVIGASRHNPRAAAGRLDMLAPPGGASRFRLKRRHPMFDIALNRLGDRAKYSEIIVYGRAGAVTKTAAKAAGIPLREIP
jgi:glycosyltransferase involved in cell wall biosynthesis